MLRIVASRAIVASAARVEVATQAARYSPQGLKGACGDRSRPGRDGALIASC